MRLRQNRLGVYYHRAKIPAKDNEGNSYTEYAPATTFKAEQWAAGGKIQAEMYGTRMSNIRNLRLEGAYKDVSEGRKTYYVFADGLKVAVGDGICFNVSPSGGPDYEVIAIKPNRFLSLELERI